MRTLVVILAAIVTVVAAPALAQRASVVIEHGWHNAALTDATRASLDPVVEAGLLDDVVISIEGHADISEGDENAWNEEEDRRADPTFSRADPEFLMATSQRRAAAVANYLVGQGVPATSIRATGFGATRPVVPGSSPRNRRVEVRATRNGGSGK